ncbi:MAG: DUF2382 domain-containing protein [Thermoanaerobaculia bacterium]
MARQTLVASFDSRGDAENAVQALLAAGFDRDHIHLHANGSAAEADTGKQKGFWESIADFFVPDDDRSVYDESVRRGGATLVVAAEEARVDEAADILERNGAVDMDERENTWRTGGWAPAVATTGEPPIAPDLASRSTAATGTRAEAHAGGLHDVEAIPLAEEKLRVGKRQVNEGRVRVRSYVVETPVEESVSLREENVSVESRSVDRAATAGDEALFRERTIEAEEVNEEAVVAKEARVKEELVVKKDVGQRTETVKDTVRHTEVDVEDTRKSPKR